MPYSIGEPFDRSDFYDRGYAVENETPRWCWLPRWDAAAQRRLTAPLVDLLFHELAAKAVGAVDDRPGAR